MALDLARAYPGISPRSYEHPADRAATSALHAVPMLDRVVKRLAQLGVESRYRQVLLGDAVRLGPEQVPLVWSAHHTAARVLDIEPLPGLYATKQPVANALTFGTSNPVVVLASPLVIEYDGAEVEAVLAHELGHVLSDHVTYQTVLVLLAQLLSGVLSGKPLAGLPVRGLYLALLEWYRAAELTGDRASAVAVGDPMTVCQMLMRMAGGALPGMQVDAFVRQATEYVGEEDIFARGARVGVELGRTHPVSVRRVAELVRWVQTGAYDRIRDGAYFRRGEELPPSAETEAAVRHYRERFAEVIDRTVGGVTKLGGQLTQWLATQGQRTSQGPERPGAAAP
jgi:Zn-dependent protease with chaperone function